MSENSKKYIKTLKINKKTYIKVKKHLNYKKVWIYFKIFSYTIFKNIQFLNHFLYKNLKYKKIPKTDSKATEYKKEFFEKLIKCY